MVYANDLITISRNGRKTVAVKGTTQKIECLKIENVEVTNLEIVTHILISKILKLILLWRLLTNWLQNYQARGSKAYYQIKSDYISWHVHKMYYQEAENALKKFSDDLNAVFIEECAHFQNFVKNLELEQKSLSSLL